MFLIFSVILMVLLDQLTKLWASITLMKVDTIPIIPTIFHLTYVENRGAAFSILQNKRGFFLIITIVVLIAIYGALQKRVVTTKIGRISLYLIAGGAIGNLIDRIFRGYVIDLFDFRIIHFPVFNVADIFVTIGGILLMYFLLFQSDLKDTKHE